MAHKNMKQHEMKVQRAARWLARWGVADGPTLLAATYAANKSWPRRLVALGLARPLDVSKLRVLNLRTVYVATSACRAVARAAGHVLVAPYTLGKDLTHRLMVERSCARLTRLGFDLGLDVHEYVAEPEMRGQGKLVEGDWMDRLPDAKLRFRSVFAKRPGENDGGVIYVEIERHIRSAKRLAIMCTGLAKLLTEQTSVHAGDAVLIVCESEKIARSYRKAMEPGAPYAEHERRGGKFVPTGRTLRMPPGVHVTTMDRSGYPSIDAAKLASVLQVLNLAAALARGKRVKETMNKYLPTPPAPLTKEQREARKKAKAEAEAKKTAPVEAGAGEVVN